MGVHDQFNSNLARFLRLSSNTTSIEPTADYLWDNIDDIHFVLLCSAILASLLVLTLTVVHLRYIVVYTSNEMLRSNMYFMVCTPLVTCGGSVVGMAMPRSAAFLYGATVSYYMVVLFINITLMQAMFGSRRALRRYMRDNNKMIKMAVNPYTCCCTCLPQFKPTTLAFRVCEGLILQTVLIRMVLQIIEICVYYELGHREHLFFTVSHILNVISMWVAFIMVYVLIDLGRERLEPYKYHILFRFTDFAQTLATIQKIGIDFLVAFEFIKGTQFFSANCAGNFYFNCLWCWEMLIMSAMATYVFQPSKTLLFDKYHTDEMELETGKEVLVGPSVNMELLLDHYEKKKKKEEDSQASQGRKTSQTSQGRKTSQTSQGRKTSQTSQGRKTSQTSQGTKTSQTSQERKPSQGTAASERSPLVEKKP